MKRQLKDLMPKELQKKRLKQLEKYKAVKLVAKTFSQDYVILTRSVKPYWSKDTIQASFISGTKEKPTTHGQKGFPDWDSAIKYFTSPPYNMKVVDIRK